MLSIKIFENDSWELRLRWFGAGRSFVKIKSRGISVLATADEHRYFQECAQIMQKNGEDLLNSTAVNSFYNDYCNAITVKGGAGWRIFFSDSPQDKAKQYS